MNKFFVRSLKSQRAKRIRKPAFTLAEVLITLGIIGVVAAMTLPTLIGKYRKTVTVNKLKKAYAEVSQAIKLSEAENGMLDSWSFPYDNNDDNTKYFLDNYFLKYFKVQKVCSKEEFSKCNFSGVIKSRVLEGSYLTPFYYILTASGYGLILHPGGLQNLSTFSPHMHIVIDIDGPTKGENRFGYDLFQSSIFFGEQRKASNESAKKSGYWMFGLGWIPELTREDLVSDPQFGCMGNSGAFCGALIQSDGWEIKDDYPVKF